MNELWSQELGVHIIRVGLRQIRRPHASKVEHVLPGIIARMHYHAARTTDPAGGKSTVEPLLRHPKGLHSAWSAHLHAHDVRLQCGVVCAGSNWSCVANMLRSDASRNRFMQ